MPFTRTRFNEENTRRVVTDEILRRGRGILYLDDTRGHDFHLGIGNKHYFIDVRFYGRGHRHFQENFVSNMASKLDMLGRDATIIVITNKKFENRSNFPDDLWVISLDTLRDGTGPMWTPNTRRIVNGRLALETLIRTL